MQLGIKNLAALLCSQADSNSPNGSAFLENMNCSWLGLVILTLFLSSLVSHLLGQLMN